jgi:hypothetical protein
MHFAPALEGTMRCWEMGAKLCIWSIFTITAACAATTQNSIVWTQSPIARADLNPAYDSLDQNHPGLAEAMARRANLERQARMRTETEKLFKLAEELKEFVGKSNENILSVDVIKKANEIEKLAHSVQQKMKGTD